MSSSLSRQTVEQLGLEDKELVQLYLELIRIIEKDIDEIKAGDTQSGWTSWAIIGGIVGALLLLLGEARKLNSLPTEEVKTIGLAGLLLYFVASFCVSAFSITANDVKPGRVRWSKRGLFLKHPTGSFQVSSFFDVDIRSAFSDVATLSEVCNRTYLRALDIGDNPGPHLL